MGLGFLDILAYAFVKDNKERRKERTFSSQYKPTPLCQKYKEELSAATSDMLECFIETFERAGYQNVPKEILTDSIILAFDAFLKVLHIQTGDVSSIQLELFDAFFNTIKPNKFSKAEFFKASKDNTQIQTITQSVGLSNEPIGFLWSESFKVLSNTSNAKSFLNRVIQNYCIFADRFAKLGTSTNSTSIQICEEFKNTLLNQYNKYYDSMQSNDSINRSEYGLITGHLSQMKNIALSLENAVLSISSDDPCVENIFNFFVCGILIDLLNMTGCDEQTKRTIFNRAIEISSMEESISGDQIITDMSTGEGASELIDFLTKTENGKYGFWGILVIMGNRVNLNEEPLNFITECTEYLKRIEEVLSVEFPNAGFDNLSFKYMLDKTEKIYEWIFK